MYGFCGIIQVQWYHLHLYDDNKKEYKNSNLDLGMVST